ncbi:MAG: cyanophycin synthetase, partial [Weeksellaceae bacterium]|nr:cyanophycin synthetase [Weeksellaceae bacterium]
NGKIFVSDGEKIQEILAVSDLRLRGEHNFGNIMAAIGATYFWGIGIQSIKKAVLNFSGIPHRLELVRKIGEVKYYNDTAATTPESAISGIKSFSEPIVLIVGGADKNLDVSELAEVILKKTKQVIFLRGQATDKILEKIKKSVPEREFSVVSSMEEAVVLAERLAEDGDIVLLSPGASSFGLFQNEFDRGDKFREAVANLK